MKQNPQKSLDQTLTPKKSHAEFPSHKNFQGNYAARIRGNHHESSDCFEYPKISLLKSSYPKNTCQNFPKQKIPKSKISNPPKIIRSSLSLEILSTPSPLPLGLMERHYPDLGSASEWSYYMGNLLQPIRSST